MPDPHLMPAFVLAVVVLMLIPGPNVALIVSNSLTSGARRGMLTALATSSGSVVQLLLVSAGMASVISQLGGWFTVLRWVGVAYLIFIGIQQWRAVTPDWTDHPVRQSLRIMFARAATISVLNPKTLLFYAAFFPQFISPDRPVAPQLTVLAALYLALAVIIDCLWALGASQFRTRLGARVRLFNRISGGVLIGAGLGLALDRSR
ncbi:MAG: LysE family translocator [Pseudomonadota bacterium]|nr:LysE family translocator [Pseudomonadota bacterium]